MEYADHRAAKETLSGGLLRYARFFYEVLGNRRRFPRAPVTGTIQVKCRGYVIETVYTCACIDVSPKGLGIESPEPMRVGSLVTLHSEVKGPSRPAYVRHCVARPESYRIGLEFAADAPARG